MRLVFVSVDPELPLDENAVIAAACDALEGRGYAIEQRLHTTQRGVDVIARAPDGTRLFIEAKGATSSRQTSRNYGKPYGSVEVRINVAEALYTAAALAGERRDGIVSAMAFQDDPLHRRYVEPLLPACDALGIEVLWVEPGAGAASG
jgi:Holliday junction resolvase-like predicted endonuclease